MRIADTIQDSIVDGRGLRFVVFTQGCLHACPGCHNPATHPLDGGHEVTVEELFRQMTANPLTDGLTLSGGEPFLQPEECARLAELTRAAGLNVWCYTGYTYEELLRLSETKPELMALLRQIDTLVDGEFILAQRSLSFRWRGSLNQRVIDVQKSLATGQTVVLE